MKATALVAAFAAALFSLHANAEAPLPPVAAKDAGFAPEGLARLDGFFAREIDKKRVPGAVVAIARDGKLVHYKAYGFQDTARGTPMPLDAVFALASMTKIMASVAALHLAEDGRLPLKSRLSDYYPAFAAMKVGVPQPDGSLRLDDQVAPDLHSGPLSPHLGPDLRRARRPSHRQALSQRNAAGAGRQHRRLHRAHHQAAAGASARHRVRIQLLHRCAGRRGREGLRAAARRVSAGQRLEAARHVRHHLPADRPAAAAPGAALCAEPARRQAAGNRAAQPADQVRLRRRVRLRAPSATTCASARC